MTFRKDKVLSFELFLARSIQEFTPLGGAYNSLSLFNSSFISFMDRAVDSSNREIREGTS